MSVGDVVGGAVTAGSIVTGGEMVIEAAGDLADASKEQEEIKRKQLRLERKRAMREAIRTSQVARATALSGAVNSGAQFSSALAGGRAQIQSASGRNITAINQDTEAALDVSHLQTDIIEAQEDIAVGNAIIEVGSALGSFIGEALDFDIPFL